MSELAVLTPSFSHDAALFADLHQSVLEYTPPQTVHYVVCPPSDKPLFQQFAGPRCRVLAHSDLLPRRYWCVPRSRGLAVNVMRPWPPVRGWIMQQVMKIAASASIDAGTVLVVDSDAVLLRPTTAARFRSGQGLAVLRAENAVQPTMRWHVLWHQVARRVLGVDPTCRFPLPDYVNPLNVWDPAIVRGMQRRVSEVTGRSWVDVFTSELSISEFVLYGVFVDEVVRGNARYESPLCHNYYERTSLDRDRAMAFASRIAPDAVGMMISSHSRTPREIRHAAFARAREALRSVYLALSAIWVCLPGLLAAM